MERLHITGVPSPVRLPKFAEDAAAGLSATPKRFNSKYFYDAVGSALFEAIMLLPEYYLTRAETEILREWGWEIVRALGNPVEFVELGSGNAAKTRLLIEEALRVQRSLRYVPVDISEAALRASAESLVESYPALRVDAFVADYLAILGGSHLRRDDKMLVMFMGSNIGNFEPVEATEFLRRLAAVLKPGDGFLLGADLRKDPRELKAAYDDAAGVTAAFNKNLLARMNRELEAAFDPKTFEHVVEYDERRGAVDSYLVSLLDQTVDVGACSRSFSFARGERIHTESAYKYDEKTIAQLAASAGLSVSRTWLDSARRFSVNLLIHAS